MTGIRNLGLSILAIVLISSAGLALKVYLNAAAELRQGDEYSAKGLPDQAAVHYERSIRWYLPGLNDGENAAEGLWKTAAQYESRGDIENALSSYRLLRGAFYSARSFFTPGRKWIGRCNEKIAELMAGRPPFSAADRAKSLERRKSEALSLLSTEKPPFIQWALLSELGFFGWVACAFLFVVKAMTPQGRIKTRQALLLSGAWAAFYGLWILGMANV
ncbi:MAG: hypothetical protein HZA02_03700 [Nitrospinae bacterium]|nr:hypothetical protein [Nitrospinota bacterium]